MTRQQLASQLREIEFESEEANLRLQEISDDEVIDSFTTCSCCGEPFIDEIRLIQAINLADDAGEFFGIMSVITGADVEEED